MATYVTGRTRTVTLQGKIHGLNRVWTLLALPPAGFARYAKFEITIATRLGTTVPYGARVTMATRSFDYEGVDIEAFNGYGGSDADSTVAALAGPDIDFEETLYGVFSISCTAEECFDVLEGGSTTDLSVDADGFPGYGGTAQKDGFKGRQIRFYERLQLGATLTSTIACDGKTSTSTHVIGVGENVEVDYRVYIQADVIGVDYQAHVLIGSLSFVDTLSGSYTYSNSDGSIVCSGGDIEIYATNLGDGITNLVSTDFMLHPPVHYTLEGRLRSISSSYSGTLDLDWLSKLGSVETVSASPNISDTVTQEKYSFAGSINGVPIPASSADEIGPCQIYLNAASLSATGEDTRDWRVLFNGRAYDSFDLTQASSESVDDGSSAASWSNVSNTSVSSVGGAIQIIVAGGTGEAKKTL